ncbi:SDR family oxidoreductase [Acetobacter tropicalis]|uniref:3-oxoacyl-[acyl-carrier protein] reductase n=1 Tax=Acetobacter tropicalis TaxID=104102 RepID=A0A094YM02_9PROT|nr:SDR family NAD(P)-dependent oxidoreductase [Acetobacter tropicalis]KAA8390690.1 SDR family oxidoreductase [Acetobacter tropicalis]KAA8393246.1 SDR family oxidoreductase [Acetobacter tropicalis]KGB23090.1 3-oxoacyl-[acyl-carrier protein] reductase [Acetobacter tropicalis]MBC9007258.1 SDR family oxidoreductase [Acetobacter tropicalis]MDO8171445.1 SDR family NAD(P)-dependent oxidoreductase [Acetobacter tropicalis]
MKPVALVTGGGKGLGAAIAGHLVTEGYRVVVGDIDLVAAEATAETLGEAAFAVQVDVSSEVSVEGMLDAAEQVFGLPWLLVNNAAVMKAEKVLDIEIETFDTVLAVNLRGTFLGCQRFARRLRAKEAGGRIVNIGSLAGENGGTATGAHYAASKGGVHTLTKVFARDLAPHDITVNAVAPGPLDLPSVAETIGAENAARVMANLPTGQAGNPLTVARMVAELARADAGSITGSIIDINSGLYMR